MTMIIFIPGFLKPVSDFNWTSSGKYIGIVDYLEKRHMRYHLMELTPEDYMLSVTELAERLVEFDNCVIVAHSYGGFIAHKFCELYPDQVRALILLDVPTKNEQYRHYLENRMIEEKGDIVLAKLRNWDLLPEQRLASHIENHIFYRGDPRRYEHMKNDRTVFIDASRAGHMVHYKMSAEVIQSISSMRSARGIGIRPN